MPAPFSLPVQDGDVVTASVERCWVHHNEFYVPSIENPAESDKKQGDGACDFKRGQYFTNSYNYYEGYHKTNLVGANDKNPAAVSGDVNADGSFDLADIVLLQKWLTADQAVLADWNAGDTDGNGKLNAADLTLLKRLLLA